MNVLAILGAAFLGAWLHSRKKVRVHVNFEEYLELLSPFEWKSGLTLHQEMKRRKGRWIREHETYVHLSNLRDEGLVTWRILSDAMRYWKIPGECETIRAYEFKLTSTGTRHRFGKPTFADLQGCGQEAFPQR